VQELQELEKSIVCQSNEMLTSLSQKIIGNCIFFPITHLLEELNSDIGLLANYKNLTSELY